MYSLQVSARDTGSPQRTSTAPVPLMINIKNENDQSPVFNSTRYFFTFREKQPAGSVVGYVYATDTDVGSFGEVKYSILSENQYFELDQGSGEVTARVQIDRDTLASEGATTPVSFQFRVLATDGALGLATRVASADVVVEIVDMNDNPPVFDSPWYQFCVSPTHDMSEALGVLQVSDRDSEPNSAHEFQIIREDDEDGFTALPLAISRNGQLRLTQAIPSAYRPAYTYTINAVDVGAPSLRSKVRVEVIVETSNDHHPRFNPLVSTVSIDEMAEVGQTVFYLRDVVSDEDTGTNGELSFQLAETSHTFQVDRRSGVITLSETLDFEEGPRSYSLTLLATDGRHGVHRTAAGIMVVTVEAGNEHTPMFVDMPSHLTLSHLPFVGLELYTVSAFDRDGGRDGEIEYSIFDNTHLFAMDRETGVLANQVEISQDGSYNLTVIVHDLGSPFRFSNTTISITIRRSANTEPEFVGSNPRTIFQAETDVIEVYLNSALSTNPPAETYHIASQTMSGQTTPIDMFSILESEGKLRTRQPLDHEETAEYRIIVESRIEVVTGTSVERLSDFLEVILIVSDVNDNLPVFFGMEDQSFSEATPPGTFLFRVHAIDADKGLAGNVSYNIIQEETFSIDSTTGEVTLNQLLDRERVSEYNLRIRARDFSSQPRSSLITVHVTITDVNDFATTYNGRNFSLDVYEYPHTISGERIIKLAAKDEDEGPLMYTMELVSFHTVDDSIDASAVTSPFTIHPDTALVTATQTLDRESVDHYLLRVTASDRLHTAETYLSVTILDVNDHTPVLTVPDGIEIWEGQPIDTLVTDRIRANDRDVGINSWVLFSLGEGWPVENYLSIHPLTGVIRINDTIVVRENNLWFDGVVVAEDQGEGKHRVELIVHLTVVEVNDRAVTFEGGESINLSVSIADKVGTPIHHFAATNEDLVGIHSSPSFQFSIPSYYAMANRNFAITPATGLLTLREEQTDVRNYNFKIDVLDPSPVPLCVEFFPSSSINVTINVRPVNTHCPQFTQASYSTDVEEEMLTTESFVHVSSYDPDGDLVTYSLLNDSSLPFTILNPQLGHISLTDSLDRETVDSYSLTVISTDDGYPPMSCSAEVIVNVLDVNDHRPAFDQQSYSGSVVENLAANSRVLQVRATDADIGDAAKVHYEIRHASVPFTVDREFGYISTTRMLDYDTLPSGCYVFTVMASDSGMPRPLSTSAEVTITVEDLNEHPPRFFTAPTQPIVVGANRVSGNLVFTVHANDSDRGAELSYSFGNPKASCYFHIDNRTGAIELKVSPPSSCSMCADILQRQPTPDSQYFTINTNLRVSDGKYTDTIFVSFLIHISFCASNPAARSILPIVIVIATSIIVTMVIILVIVCVFMFTCRARGSSKVGNSSSTFQSQRTFVNSSALI